MEILLLSCNMGEGHNSTAGAIREALEARGAACVTEDALGCISPGFSQFISNWHKRLYRHMPGVQDLGVRVLEQPGMEPPGVYELLSQGAWALWGRLTAGDYDGVVCTHIFPALMMTRVRQKWNCPIPTYFVNTDYAPTPFLHRCDLDGYFIPGKDLMSRYTEAGAPREKLIPSGIPVRQDFCVPADKEMARKTLGLGGQRTIVLLVCGSMGCGPMERIAAGLCRGLPGGSLVIAICGTNEKLRQTLRRLEDPRLQVLGYTKDMPLYMAAADLIVTKPGGLSSTEAANMHLPMVFINAVGGCEEENFRRFVDRGYALGSRDPEEVVAQAAALARDPARLALMRQLLAEDFCGSSAAMIAEHVLTVAWGYHQCIRRKGSGHPFYKGGCDMEFMNSQTRLNLARSFAGESQARTRYTVYAQVARKENCEWIARIFEETAANEAVHAEEFLEILRDLGGLSDNLEVTAGYPYQLGSTVENLGYAADGEKQEHDDAYPGFAEIARREGYKDAARLWMQIARIEGVHHNTFKTLEEQLLKGELTEKEEPILWRCLNCGYTYEGVRACDPCPVCGKSAGWQEGELNRKETIPKK